MFKNPGFKRSRRRSAYHPSRLERSRYNRTHYGGKGLGSILGDPFGGRRRHGPNRFVLLAVGGGILLALIAVLPLFFSRHRITVSGLPPNRSMSPKALSDASVLVTVDPLDATKTVTFSVDGKPGNLVPDGTSRRWVPGVLADGIHTITVRSGSRLLWRSPARKTFRVRIDSTNPTVTIDEPRSKVTTDQPLTVSGTVEEGSEVTVNGQAASVTQGRFSVRLASPPIGLLHVVATDEAGNSTLVEKRSFVQLPAIQGVHMTAISWVTSELRNPVLEMAAEKRINTVVLDLKDESGLVGYRSSIPKVAEIGAGPGQYDLKTAVADIHARGLRVAGRLVAFRDPVYAGASVKAGRLDEVVQDASGQAYKSTYGAFTNPASKAVQTYLYAIAREAADDGVDDIFLDYVRRPEGPIGNMSFPGLSETNPDTVATMIVDFVDGAASALAPTKSRLGVSVFGIAAKRPDDIGQNIPELARHVDYVAPMVYPSHWGPGFYNVSDPANSPYEIVSRSLEDFRGKIGGTDAVLIPWLQDFTLAPGKKYGAPEVRAQIKASREQGSIGFMLWDARVTYTPGGVPADAPVVPVPAVVAAPPVSEAATVEPASKPTTSVPSPGDNAVGG
jgi:hypothetical protein